MGHSAASLYKKTSIACPFTNGSLGSCTSRGTISDEDGFLAAFVNDAKVLERGRKGEEECVDGAGAGEAGGLENAGWEGESVAEASEPTECDRPEMGTVKLCRFWFEACGDSVGLSNSSSGTSSGAGIGIPRPAATN